MPPRKRRRAAITAEIGNASSGVEKKAKVEIEVVAQCA